MTMIGLLPDWHPITFAWGILAVDFDRGANLFGNWRRKTRVRVSERELTGQLSKMLQHMDPLTQPPARELIVQTRSGGLAYFQNAVHGADPAVPVSYLAKELGCVGVAVRCIPNTIKKDGTGSYGAVSFELFGKHPTDFLNYIRSVAAANDGGRWVFTATGTVQEFEDLDQYKARRIADRFTPEMLKRYGESLGLDLFSEEFYGGRARLFESELEGGVKAVLSVQTARAKLRLPS
jgi:hypothetical protein